MLCVSDVDHGLASRKIRVERSEELYDTFSTRCSLHASLRIRRLLVMNVSPLPAECRKSDSTSKKRPANVPLASFLTEICGFDPEIPETLAFFEVTSSEDLAVLRDEHLKIWFNHPSQIVILCRLQMV